MSSFVAIAIDTRKSGSKVADIGLRFQQLSFGRFGKVEAGMGGKDLDLFSK